jgi:hypothetical protein
MVRSSAMSGASGRSTCGTDIANSTGWYGGVVRDRRRAAEGWEMPAPLEYLLVRDAVPSRSSCIRLRATPCSKRRPDRRCNRCIPFNWSDGRLTERITVGRAAHGSCSSGVRRDCVLCEVLQNKKQRGAIERWNRKHVYLPAWPASHRLSHGRVIVELQARYSFKVSAIACD